MPLHSGLGVPRRDWPEVHNRDKSKGLKSSKCMQDPWKGVRTMRSIICRAASRNAASQCFPARANLVSWQPTSSSAELTAVDGRFGFDWILAIQQIVCS
jgi:hypothetical protein